MDSAQPRPVANAPSTLIMQAGMHPAAQDKMLFFHSILNCCSGMLCSAEVKQKVIQNKSDQQTDDSAAGRPDGTHTPEPKPAE